MKWIDDIEKRIIENDLDYLPVESSVDLSDVKRLIKAVKISLEAFYRIDLVEPYSGIEYAERFTRIKDIAYDAFEALHEIGDEK